MVYRLEVEDGELVLGVGSSAEPRAVQPTVVDEFVGDGFSVEFRREEGQVTGFTVHAGRVRGLLFERQGSTRPLGSPAERISRFRLFRGALFRQGAPAPLDLAFQVGRAPGR